MAGNNRLPEPAGRLLDRARPVAFTFAGRRYNGFEGDTIASALAANGVWMLSRSFKYHRPRGVLTMAGHDANTLVQLPGEPNVFADRYRISEGLRVEAQNVFGSLENDRGAWLETIGRFLPVGFYYKALYKPKGASRFWEPIIRRLAGLGEIDVESKRGYYDSAYGFCDVAVIGGGPAGMAAALEAAASGAEVMLCEQEEILGGSLAYARFDAEGARGQALLDDLTAAVAAHPGIEVMTRATCNGWFADNRLPVIKGNRLYRLRAKSVVVATGSLEQHMVFRNNDLPGIMLGSAAQRLIRLYGVRPGRRAVVASANGDGYGVALDLAEVGVDIAAVIDLRTEPASDRRAEAVRDRGIRVVTGHAPWEAVTGPGKRHVKGVKISRVIGEGACAAGAETIACDLVCTSTGYSPDAAMLHHANATMTYDEATAMFAVATLPAHIFAAGSVNGAYDLAAAVGDGRHAGARAGRDAGCGGGADPPAIRDKGALGETHPWPMFPHPKGKDFVDFDEDIVVDDIRNAVADGFDDIELLKRYSVVGMGPSQGRHSSVPSVRLFAKATDRPVKDVGTTTSRPPIAAEKLAHLAGRGFEPMLLTPIHDRHIEAGALMRVTGRWLRPYVYGPEDEAAETVRAEVLNVRNNVGVIDVSTLGGLEIRGPDAAEFLNRISTCDHGQQPVGRVRYLLMTDMAGFISDDGVACRFAEDHFYATTSTAGAEATYRRMLFYNAQWRLDVDVTNVTTAYCAVNLVGPNSRQVFAKLCDDVDLSAEAFPFMGVRTGHVAGIPARILRIGYVGEFGYEVHVPASQGEALWDALIEAGRDRGIMPFGTEAQRLLRLEKGHPVVGEDTDGLTYPREADMKWAVAGKKPFFVGGRSLHIHDARPLERRLVGFTIEDKGVPVPEEGHLVIRNGNITGRVTSCGHSPSLGKIIGLAFVAPDQTAIDCPVEIKVAPGRTVEARVAERPFYDPRGERQGM